MTVIVFCLSVNLIAQTNSQYELRLQLDSIISCTTIYARIEVKVSDGLPPFYLADQAYNISLDTTVLTNPRIVQELEVSGALFGNNYSAFYETHIGRFSEAIFSYEVVLGGGTGYPIDDTRWYPVGQIAFDVLEKDADYALEWKTAAAALSPTLVYEKDGGTLFVVDDDSYAIEGATSCSLPAPFEPSVFEGIDDACTIKVNWTTSSETNFDYYNVEKSYDGINWISIGKVAAAGTSTTPLSYLIRDYEIAGVINYYRIQLVYFDAKTVVSNVITVRTSCFDGPIVFLKGGDIFPNPAKPGELVSVLFFLEEREGAFGEIIVADKLGIVKYRETKALVRGRNTFSFDADLLAKGVHFVKIKSKNIDIRKLLIKVGGR